MSFKIQIIKYIFEKITFILDKVLWLFIKIFPDNFIKFLIINRPFLNISFLFIKFKPFNFHKYIAYSIIKLDRKSTYMSSCLSKSLLGRILFDCFRIPNVLHLGMEKNEKGTKVAHAWLTNLDSKIKYTNGLNETGVKIISF